MAYDPTENTLPSLPKDVPKPVLKPRRKSWLEKTAVKLLLLFSLVVVVVASLAIGALVLSANSQQASDQSNNPGTDESSQTDPVAEDMSDDMNSENSSPEEEINKDEGANPAEPEVTADESPDTAEWTRLMLDDLQVSFLLPPAKAPHLFTEGGKVWSWNFMSSQEMAEVRVVDLSLEFQAKVIIKFAPGGSGFDGTCGSQCTAINQLSIYFIDSELTPEGMIQIFQEAITRANENLEAETTPNAITYAPIEGRTNFFEVNVELAGASDRFILGKQNSKLVLIRTFSDQTYPQATADLVEIVSSLSF